MVGKEGTNIRDNLTFVSSLRDRMQNLNRMVLHAVSGRSPEYSGTFPQHPSKVFGDIDAVSKQKYRHVYYPAFSSTESNKGISIKISSSPDVVE